MAPKCGIIAIAGRFGGAIAAIRGIGGIGGIGILIGI